MRERFLYTSVEASARPTNATAMRIGDRVLTRDKLVKRALGLIVAPYNQVRLVVLDLHRSEPNVDSRLQEVRDLALTPSDISSHLERLYRVALQAEPRLIVELGVRGGSSTFALERAADATGALLISVDVEDSSYVSSLERWRFVRSDDVEFGWRFRAWARDNGIPYPVDVLFVDTSHLYDHTLAELEAWLPHMALDGAMVFHDTNLTLLYRRSDGTLGIGWDNRRGVIRALEETFGFTIDESRRASFAVDGWMIDHTPICNGLTVVQSRKANKRTDP